MELNDAGVTAAGNHAVYDLVTAVAASDLSVDNIAMALRLMHEQATPPGSASDDRDQAEQP